MLEQEPLQWNNTSAQWNNTNGRQTSESETFEVRLLRNFRQLRAHFNIYEKFEIRKVRKYWKFVVSSIQRGFGNLEKFEEIWKFRNVKRIRFESSRV